MGDDAVGTMVVHDPGPAMVYSVVANDSGGCWIYHSDSLVGTIKESVI